MCLRNKRRGSHINRTVLYFVNSRERRKFWFRNVIVIRIV